MTNATLTEHYVLSILHQESEGADFPINFDDIWESSGYTHKHHAVRFLTERCDAVEGEDYLVLPERVQTPNGGRSSHLIRLSSDGYEFFLSRSNTPQGKANLRCLIQIKKAYVKQLERQLNATAQPNDDLIKLKTHNEYLAKELREVFALTDELTEMYQEECNQKTKIERQNTRHIEVECYLESALQEKTEELQNLNSEYHDLYEENKKLKELNDALLSDDYFEQVSPDLRIRRGYWAELMTIYSENCELRAKLGIPNLKERTKKLKS